MVKIGRFLKFGSNLDSIKKKIFLKKSKFGEGCDTPQIIKKCQLKKPPKIGIFFKADFSFFNFFSIYNVLRSN